MRAEWSVECAAEDPMLEVPWKDAAGKCAFVDLRANPYDFDLIPEAEQHPALMQALRALNATRSPVFTAKCDAWPLDDEALKAAVDDLDADVVGASAGWASYIDMVPRERILFTSFHRQEQLLRRLVRMADAVQQEGAILECVLRPALVDFSTAQQGFAISLYVKAVGADERVAVALWAQALSEVVALVRGRELWR